jgi:hypothetical protein
MRARVLVFENRVAAVCQEYPASVRASREVLPVQFRRSRGAVNARRGVARNARMRCNGPSSREDRCTLAMRVVGPVKTADVPGVRALAPNTGLGGGALGVQVHRASPRAEQGSRRHGWSRGAGAGTPTLNVRGRSRVGKATPVRKGAGGPCRGACESAELVRVRYERHSLLFGRSWRELTPPLLLPSERARTR